MVWKGWQAGKEAACNDRADDENDEEEEHEEVHDGETNDATSA